MEDKEAWAFSPAFDYQTEPGGARFSSSTPVGMGVGAPEEGNLRSCPWCLTPAGVGAVFRVRAPWP